MVLLLRHISSWITEYLFSINVLRGKDEIDVDDNFRKYISDFIHNYACSVIIFRYIWK